MDFFGHGENSISIDHIIPLSKGGSNEPINLALCCKKCNTKKEQPIRTKHHPRPQKEITSFDCRTVWMGGKS
jgi:5-methylcytosine-specific restriction endonuclease McrA